MATWRRKVRIVAQMGHGDCDDCGSYEHGTANIEVEGEPMAVAVHDGHLGGGPWDGGEVWLLRAALGLAGWAPFIGGELAEGIPLVESGRMDGSGSPLWIPVHEAGPAWARLDVELDTLGDDPWYPTPVQARWVGAGGEPRAHDFEQGSWEPFWRDLCASMVDVDIEIDRRALDEEWDGDWD